MKKTLYLHIGHYKTGTSALQWFLANNARYLARHGIEYLPGHEHSKHSRLAFALMRAAGVETLMHGYADPTPPEQIWEAMIGQVRASAQPRVVLSSEEFIRLGAFGPATEHLAQIVAPTLADDDIDIRIIAYLRSPGDHLRSWYNQLIKLGVSTPDFATAVSRRMDVIHYDYAAALKPWREIFGADAVTVRPYVRGGDKDDALLADFMGVLGVDWNGGAGAVLSDFDNNPRLPPEQMHLMRVTQSADQAPEAINWLMARAEAYFESDAGVMNSDAEGALARVGEQIAHSLDALADVLPAETLEAFRRDRADTGLMSRSEARAWQLAGFLLSELHVQRLRTRQRQVQIEERLAAIEASLAAPE